MSTHKKLKKNKNIVNSGIKPTPSLTSIQPNQNNKKSQETPQLKQTPQQPENTSPQFHGLYILPVKDTTPTNVITNNTDMDDETAPELQRFLYWTPKVATIDVPEITEEQADALDQDDLYERFRIERSVLLYGVPAIYCEKVLEYIFSYFGEIESVFFHPSNDYLSRVAEITMVDDDGYGNIIDKSAETRITVNVELVLAQEHEKQVTVNPAATDNTFGINKYFTQFIAQRPDYSALQDQVDLFMMAFDDRTEAQRKSSKKQIVDDDGFILVTGDDRTLDIGQKKFKQQTKDKRKREELKLKEIRNNELSFYKFHEEQKQKKEELKQRSQFNKDKLIINKLRQTRTFNPF